MIICFFTSLFARKAKVRIIIRLTLSPFALERLFHKIRVLKVRGYLSSPEGGSVEIIAEGPKPRLEQLIEFLRNESALIGAKSLEITWLEYQMEFLDFRLVE